VNFFSEEGDAGPYKPVVRHIDVRDLTCEQGEYALYLRGYRDAPIRDVRLTNCRFSNIAQANLLENVEDLVLDEVIVNGARLG
jgi:hypothetical protein